MAGAARAEGMIAVMANPIVQPAATPSGTIQASVSQPPASGNATPKPRMPTINITMICATVMIVDAPTCPMKNDALGSGPAASWRSDPSCCCAAMPIERFRNAVPKIDAAMIPATKYWRISTSVPPIGESTTAPKIEPKTTSSSSGKRIRKTSACGSRAVALRASTVISPPMRSVWRGPPKPALTTSPRRPAGPPPPDRGIAPPASAG